ncbi:hypothetical protein CEUSTIGMA_g9373.t1 [Chlamydomonas eustigma]|uniref:NAD(P)-binding domain-containing protein n=1 Tax=Chlamydomonas eustigma TaxID=1157962 RepID=A0A250XFT6_9CHLO|nr:hypothetical protein CEUSTIGMA_g9373.t1 [Chlamydomonas eustigma]|eukprot:GAX81945.1 hypothetical protein CEUSTIGMA_g9373.t1 [Chlamydomonas eustigma]
MNVFFKDIPCGVMSVLEPRTLHLANKALKFLRSTSNYDMRRISSCAFTQASHPGSDTRADKKGSAESLPGITVVVLGGRGFVGSQICKAALESGMKVVSISRSGTAPLTQEPWARDVEWARGNVLEPQTYLGHLQGASAVISCVGGFGNQAEMLKVNGTANVVAVETAKAVGVPRYVFVSATIPKIPGLGMILGGYINGKTMAEEAVRKHFPDSGVCLRPGVVYGDRIISNSLTLPLGYVFQPVERLLLRVPQTWVNLPLIGGLFVPPISAAALARAAVAAASDASVSPGIMDVPMLQKYK